jgi:hypothetical protein
MSRTVKKNGTQKKEHQCRFRKKKVIATQSYGLFFFCFLFLDFLILDTSKNIMLHVRTHRAAIRCYPFAYAPYTRYLRIPFFFLFRSNTTKKKKKNCMCNSHCSLARCPRIAHSCSLDLRRRFEHSTHRPRPLRLLRCCAHHRIGPPEAQYAVTKTSGFR